ncbi:MAG: FapA family protein [Desulfuromonadaceae bacterium]|nr:FapA family protein [Desulfuromonadaceae bacterium]MDD2847809.1 FapA family protein [Desulfuromonadaceae bacterium]MDD4129646.1 FapA family protein [Desulfuromonadaceae bacterium]
MTDQHEPADSSPPLAIGGNEIKKLGYSLYIRIPDSGLECRCSYVPHDQGSMMTGEELTAFLKQYNVHEGIDRDAFDGFVLKATAGQQQLDVLLASGIEPVAGADEHLSLSVQSSAAVRSGEEDITKVDMHIVQAFINVYSGDEIGRIIPAEPGIPGKNIMGQPIPAQPGKPLHVKIGKNIRAEEDGALLIASATGRLCCSAAEISVEEEYLVKGDVNFRIGSINFKGVVEVRGDVLDHFDITASKGLTVTGNIGVCNIVSDGDVTFCGMDGQDTATITCGGTLRAHFIHDVIVECAGDVIVDVEIHNCTIRTLGRIIVDKGAISGGSYIALGGIEAKKLGSASSQHTKLHAGVDYHDVELLEGLFASLAETQEKAKNSQSLTEIAELRKTSAALTDSIMAIRNKADSRANAKINAKAVIYENVHLTVGSVTEEINEQKDGPHSVIENSIEGGLRFLSMTSLDVKATDIELAFVREQKMALRT